MESTNIIANNAQVAQVKPVSFEEALQAQGKVTAAELFTSAYARGNQKAIPESALRNVWPESPIVADKVESYLDNVYYVQYCALQYWQYADNGSVAEEWRTKGMNTWAAILNVAGSDYKRNNTDWIYIVSRATIDGKESKDTTKRVVKPMSKTAFRRRIEMLIGLAINGFVFVNTNATIETIQQTRALNAQKAKEREEKRIAKEAEKEAKKQAQDAPAASEAPAIAQPVSSDAITQTAGKPAPAKQPKQQPKKAKQQETQTDSDTLPAFDGLFDDMIIPGETSADISAA